MSRFFLPRLLVLALGLFAVLSFVQVVPVFAADEVTEGLTTVGEETGLSDEDPRIIVARIIRTGLSVLGIIFLLLIIYGGFTWMTSGGNEERVERAKKILVRAAIGLAIILMSWAIATFVISALLGATGGDGSGGGDGDGTTPLGGSTTSSFTVTDYSPEGAVSIRNIELRVTFSKNVDDTTVDGNIVVTNTATSTPVDGVLETSGNSVSFTPSAPCPAPNEDRFCFDENTTFNVSVSENIKSTADTSLVCTSDSCTSSFTSGSLVDTEDPTADLTAPDDGDTLSVDALELVQVHATDDSQVSAAAFGANGTDFDSIGAAGDDLSDLTIETFWDTTGLTPRAEYRLTATVTDIAGNTDTDSVSVTLLALSCFNDVVDAGETGLNCGGDTTSTSYCGACSGSSCTADSECASGSCVEGVCTEVPTIDSISPDSGAVGTYVTISGSGFGNTEGTITFAAASGGTVAASIPDCGDGWTSTQIVVEVPSGAASGPITLSTEDGLSESTNDATGPLIDDFEVNDEVHSKLCDLTPSSGAVEDAVVLSGAGFGDSRSSSTVRFGSEEVGSYTTWSAGAIATTVPDVNDGYYDVVVTVDGVESNTLQFAVETTTTDAPTLGAIEPSSGPVGEYLTLTGTNFGNSIGSVWFVSDETGESAQGSIDFPDACLTEFWNDNQITIIVPPDFTGGGPVALGSYQVYVQTADTTPQRSNSVAFTIDNGEPDPGICAVTPESGAAGDTVTITGYGFSPSSGRIVTFYNNVASDVLDGSTSSITVTVPNGTSTGPLYFTNSFGQESNRVNFELSGEVSSAAVDAASASYAWSFSTGEIPETPDVVVECSEERVSAVPNEQFTTEACVNDVIYAEFTTLMNAGSVADAVTIEQCTAGGDRPCSATDDITADGALDVDSSSEMTYFTWTPAAPLATSTTYRVTVAATAMSADSVAMQSDVSWEFTTKVTTDSCTIESVRVSPANSTIEEQYGTEDFHALPVAGCEVLDATSYAWAWTIDESYADFTTGTNTSDVTARGLAEGETLVNAEETASGINDDGELRINFTDPYVTQYWPNCDTACRNAEIGASFNTTMDPLTLLPAVELYSCENELCASASLISTASVACATSECREVNVVVDDLTPGDFYKAVIGSSATSTSGVPLTRGNDGGNFAWTFRVREDGAVCAIDRISISPDAPTAEVVGAREDFSVDAFGSADSCSVAGQQLSTSAYSWSWTDPIPDDGSDEDIDVAEWWLSGLVDTDLSGIAAGCTALCTALGSETYAAICGDGETDTGEDCDEGDTLSGDGCSSSCLFEGSSDVYDSTCGDGYVGNGEECDDRNAASGDGCSAVCLNEGASAVLATCGNNDLAYEATQGGEDCDDGNTVSGDGCSANCLNEGSPTYADIGGAVCGDDATTEPYEECDDGGVVDGDGCSARCLFEGSSDVYDSSCGDGYLGNGEACDDGNTVNGDGCSSVCLREGSSTGYTTPSFCGDGSVGTGEWAVCEAGGGDGNIDGLQIAEITEDATREVDLDTNTAVADIEVLETSSELFTSTTYTLTCSAGTDQDCTSATDSSVTPETYGVGTANCCAMRPTVVSLSPAGIEVCRNAALLATFSQEMDVSSFSASNGDGTTSPQMYLKVDLTTTGGVCPSSHTTLAVAPEGLLPRAWFTIRQFFAGLGVDADAGDCVIPVVAYSQTVDSEGQGTVRLSYDTPLEPDATYTLVIEADDNVEDATSVGVRSQNGVAVYSASGDVTQNFTTQSDLCTLDEVTVEDTDESANVFSQDEESHEFVATAYARNGATPEAIEPLSGVYDWTWTSWDDDQDEAIVIVEANEVSPDEATVTAAGENGTSNVSATATVTTDTVSDTAGTSIVGSTTVTAFLCENPWPAIENFPFIDDETGTANGAEEGAAWTNFSTAYCKDTGEEGRDDDYPSLTVVRPPVTNTDNVFKEYLFEVNDGSGDAIGVRVISNEDYLSPELWYAAQSFSGEPSETTVDGFAAVEDGRTTYVSAPNETDSGIYANIYAISYNEGASSTTEDIAEQMIENLQFTTNVDGTALCLNSDGSAATDADGETIACTSDIDCAGTTDAVCGDQKSKLRRDIRRLGDMTTIEDAVATYGESNGACSATTSKLCSEDDDCPGTETCEPINPTLASGTYVRGLAASPWESWSEVLGSGLGDSDLVADPLNTYVDCGSDSYAAYDADTCVDSTTGHYVCPEGSYVYHYRAVGSEEYQLAADLEYTGSAWINSIDDDTTDAVTVEIGNSSSTADGFTTGSFCDGATVYGAENVCGDGVVGSGEVCERGESGGSSTSCDLDESTDDDGDGDATNDADGIRSETCNSTCSAWEEDSDATCVASTCGDGVLDAANGEECDDGVQNGRYGYCGSSCTYDSGFYCGDGSLAGGEACDCGAVTVDAEGRPTGGTSGTCVAINGTYNSNPNLTCAWDCQGPAAYCGDGSVDSGEVCDGNVDTWDGELCNAYSGTLYGEPCTADDQCEGGGGFFAGLAACGSSGGTAVDACEADASGRPTTRTLSCNDDGASGQTCDWASDWLSLDCEPVGSCGDGTLDASEECDDGNTTSTDACTNSCTANVCGDGVMYVDVEQCDEGVDNGGGCDAAYGSTCTACSLACRYEVSSGEFCGDGVQNGDEYCDANDVPYAFWDEDAGVAGACEPSDNGLTWSDVYGEDYAYTDDSGTAVTADPVCERVGVCNGGDNNGQFCSGLGDCGLGADAGTCVYPSCNLSCASTCPFTYASTSVLLESNESGAPSAESVDLYSYSEESTSTLPNAAEITVPSCTAVSSFTADVTFADNYVAPQTYIVFVTDLSRSMKWEVSNDTDPETESGEQSRLEIVQSSMNEAVIDLYSELGSDVYIGAVGYKGIVANECFDDATSCTTDADCSGGVCNDADSNGQQFDFVDSSGQSELISEITGYIYDHSANGTLTQEGIEMGKELLDAVYTENGPINHRYIMILLTDGDWTTTDPASTASNVRSAGYEFYTAAITSDEDLIDEVASWSSGNPADSRVDYAYDAQTSDELEEMYSSIIDSILNITVSLIATATDGTTYTSSTQVNEGIGVELPWPEGFACDGSNEQQVPLRLTFQGEGQITVSNVQVNYCAP